MEALKPVSKITYFSNKPFFMKNTFVIMLALFANVILKLLKRRLIENKVLKLFGKHIFSQ
jgi:hypothetical protein